MCGIFCSLSREDYIQPSAKLQQRLESRGPDSTRTFKTSYSGPTTQAAGTTYITLTSTVLSLRGSQIITQPFQDAEQKYTLCWNGEAWSIDGDSPPGNDTEAIYRLLVNALESSNPSVDTQCFQESAQHLSRELSRVAGPYAFVFVDHINGTVYLGRDFLGRRSLLVQASASGDLLISSVSGDSSADGWEELEAAGVYYVDLAAPDVGVAPADIQIRTFGSFTTELAPYHFADPVETRAAPSVIPCLSLNKELSTSRSPLDQQSPSMAKLETLSRDALALRVLNIPDPPDRTDDILHSRKARLAVLFSGGLDCTVLARMSHDLLPDQEPIDLLNVAFENPRIHKPPDSNESMSVESYEQCPDRITGRASYAELQRTCPGREWRFVAINIPYTETQEHRQNVISLMHPHNTEMDLSISLALYFAARGRGQIDNFVSGKHTPYTTSARVLLSGLGADELFGGYTRHATAYRRGGLPALLDELELDVSRLGKRNLGRDDRVMAHWGREVRFPYLDEKLLKWALNGHVNEKCGFGERVAEGADLAVEDDSRALEPGKKVLRCLAWKLGMRGVAKEKKRAIQFGARTAKMETRKTKGTQLLS